MSLLNNISFSFDFYTCIFFNHRNVLYIRLVGSVGRVPDYRAGGHGFKPWLDHHSGPLKIIEKKSTAFVMTSANG